MPGIDTDFIKVPIILCTHILVHVRGEVYAYCRQPTHITNSVYVSVLAIPINHVTATLVHAHN